MTLDVQARMKAMNTELDERLKHISIDDVNLSVRTLNALKKEGVRTLYDALKTLIDKQLHKQHGVGRKTLSEIKEVIWSAKSKFPPPPEVTRHTRRVKLNSLLLAYETHVLALYTYQRADVDNERFRDIDLGASIAKRKAAIERVREEIMKYADFKEE